MIFVAAFVLTVLFTPAVRTLAMRFGIVDDPGTAPERKIHTQPIPLLGGIAVMLGFWIAIFLYVAYQGLPEGSYLLPKHLYGLFVATCILAVGGYGDDRYHLKPQQQILFAVAAILVVIASGIGVHYISNPFGETVFFNAWQWKILTINGVPYHITPLADVVTFVWLLVMMYATKLSDGLDGLVTGLGGIASLVIFFLSLAVGQPETATLALALTGACLGFLVFNWHPARIFLGEGGSLWLGFILGVLSIVSGSKIATTLLVVGLPLLDMVWVVVRRSTEGRSPFSVADRKHLHHRLLEAGFSHRKSVLILWVLSILFGGAALLAGGREKALLLGGLVGVMVALGSFVLARRKKS